MNKFFQKYGVTIYLLVLMSHLYAQLLGYVWLQALTKLGLLPLLIGYLRSFEVHPSFKQARKWVLIGLFGSFLGDAFLLSEDYFILGMVAFMSTHVFNILFFNQIVSFKQPKLLSFKIAAFVLIAFCLFIYAMLQATIGALIFPILIYMLLIAAAALMAVQVAASTVARPIAFFFWIPGMCFFIFSDTLLALNKFSWSLESPLKYIGIATMATYGIAQLLLVKGFQLQLSK